MSDRKTDPGPADGSVLADYRSGNVSAFDLLVDRHEAALLRFATSILHEATKAEDIVQESFLRLLRKGPDLGSEASLGPWLFRVCRNLAYDMRKMDTREAARREKVVYEEPLTPDAQSEQQEVLSLVQRELQNLPQREREAIWLKVHEGWDYAQIGEVLGVKAGTVGWIVHAGMNRLTARLRMAQAI
ncbi:MAG: sigma-70 family RNA polymerase sigma factor [Planctomycetota bacterium]